MFFSDCSKMNSLLPQVRGEMEEWSEQKGQYATPHLVVDGLSLTEWQGRFHLNARLAFCSDFSPRWKELSTLLRRREKKF
jgi:hypothetical protein